MSQGQKAAFRDAWWQGSSSRRFKIAQTSKQHPIRIFYIQAEDGADKTDEY
jgi:hypothetical protein